ncbi:MAG: phosphonate C-P lyase system protein PhnH [Alphaproteobacteria bacterium]
MSETSAAIPLGFARPVHDANLVFRRVLQAMSRPGRVLDCGAASAPPPAPLGPAAAAILLTLADLDTPVWLDGAARLPEVEGFIRFHTGAPLVGDPNAAAFIVATAARRVPSLDDLPQGSDLAPEQGCTLIAEVDDLSTDEGYLLNGPGIRQSARLAARGLSEKFWIERWQMQARFPRGIDIVFTAGRMLAALPRTTKVEF